MPVKRHDERMSYTEEELKELGNPRCRICRCSVELVSSVEYGVCTDCRVHGICRHCLRLRKSHVDDKCLFDPTAWDPFPAK